MQYGINHPFHFLTHSAIYHMRYITRAFTDSLGRFLVSASGELLFRCIRGFCVTILIKRPSTKRPEIDRLAYYLAQLWYRRE
jgi:hypothetical protein